ncbi:MAG: glucose sorbosone dehydrogenase [Verrucomicrobiales bacterium]|nr:glucose sorbosone dehydrogenase [Verrucomicrobiales bacterium]
MGRVLSLFTIGVLCLLPTSSSWGASCLTRTNSPSLPLPTTLNTSGYATEAIFPGLQFSWPVAVSAPPGETNRLFVAEKDGYISVITNLSAPTRSVFLDMHDIAAKDVKEDGLLGMAFHPNYATNGYVYVFYTTLTNGTKWDCIARFQADPQNPNRALRQSHTVILYQIDTVPSHNGGDLHFGPDGYLYGSLGDPNNTYQQVNNLHSGMLRIDVDKRPGNIPPNPVTGTTTQYYVPIDNPYIGATTLNGNAIATNQTRTEFYAIGLRHPWRFSFDSLTGDLYVGDVGLSTYEEVNVVQKGKNYGWGYAEGTSTNNPAYAAYLTPPLYQYGHTQGLAVIGGNVYRGAAIPDLYGCYVFGDYASGTIWSFRYQGGQATEVRELCNYPAMICFGTDPRNGDILLASDGTSLQRITKIAATNSVAIPALLSQTGAFSDLTNLTTVPGIVPYEINVPFWSDNAEKKRWYMIPDGQQIGFQRDENWHFPVGTTWVKHFDLEMVTGNPASKRKIETRFLVSTVDGAYGLSYAWNAAQTDATLVSSAGTTSSFTVTNGGVPKTQVWTFPGRSQCLTCHTRHSEFALGFNTRQLNRDVPCGGGMANQIEAMSDAGYFTAPVTNRYLLPAFSSSTDTNNSLEFRARSYLAANCSQCHQRFGWGFGNWDARVSTPFMDAGLITAEVGDFGYLEQMIYPGNTNSTLILQRMKATASGRMPPLATSVLDTNGINLMSQWVQSLANRQSFTAWLTANALTGVSGTVDTDGDGASNYSEYLAGTNPKNSTNVWKSTISNSANHLQVSYSNLSNRVYEIQWSTNVLGGWQALDHPNNSPNPKLRTGTETVDLGSSTNANYFYRVQVRDP